MQRAQAVASRAVPQLQKNRAFFTAFYDIFVQVSLFLFPPLFCIAFLPLLLPPLAHLVDTVGAWRMGNTSLQLQQDRDVVQIFTRMRALQQRGSGWGLRSCLHAFAQGNLHPLAPRSSGAAAGQKRSMQYPCTNLCERESR